eukprot:9088115-Alexandrium_andersonii.AAC.1
MENERGDRLPSRWLGNSSCLRRWLPGGSLGRGAAFPDQRAPEQRALAPAASPPWAAAPATSAQWAAC